MKLKAEYDPETKALYISIVDPARDKQHYGTTVEKPIYGIFAMDLTREGDVQGYEFMDIDLEILKDESNTTSSTETPRGHESRKARRNSSRSSYSSGSGPR